MKKLREMLWVKALAVLLCIAVGSATVLGCFYIIEHRDGFLGRDYYESDTYYRALYDHLDYVQSYLDILSVGLDNLNYLQKKDLDSLSASFDPSSTNFRFTIQDLQSGKLLFDNTGGKLLEELQKENAIGAIHVSDYGVYTVEQEGISQITTESHWGDGKHTIIDNTYVTPSKVVTPTLLDGTPLPARVLVSYTTLSPLTYDDAFLDGQKNFGAGNPLILWLTAAGGVVFLALLIFLCCAVGYRANVEGIHRTWLDKIPYDLFLALVLLLAGCGIVVFGALGVFDYGAVWTWPGGVTIYNKPIFGVILLAGATFLALFLAALLSTAARIKSRTLLRNMVLWRLCAFLWRKEREIARALPLAWRAATLFLGYLVVNAFLSLWLFTGHAAMFFLLLLVLFNGFVLGCICRWAVQWVQLRADAARIVGGEADAKIDTEKLYPDLKAHAETLNDLNSAVNKAVDARMKSERFKAELITNVSHDLKTPLTSIINYVDLLKKVDIQDETAREYIDVLDRKSQRLKKLTEDLVEASKASTGVLTVNRERLGLGQLIGQAVGEYSERLEKSNLTLVLNLPEEELYVWADGRHLWRILDNLLSNCCKYAMPGTRVYLDAAAREEQAVVLVKNVSKEPLNVPAEQLLERFVRGDEARFTEGSGLGLSIAQSLTELQGGVFSVSIDGDLFKAEAAIPRMAALSRDSVL